MAVYYAGRSSPTSTYTDLTNNKPSGVEWTGVTTQQQLMMIPSSALLPMAENTAESWNYCQNHTKQQGNMCQQVPVIRTGTSAAPANYSNSCPQGVKKKRQRTAFTSYQMMALEQEYARGTYLERSRRMELSLQVKLKDNVIKVWFQNRRMKDKKLRAAEQEACDSVCSSSESVGSTDSGMHSLPIKINGLNLNERSVSLRSDVNYTGMQNNMSREYPTQDYQRQQWISYDYEPVPMRLVENGNHDNPDADYVNSDSPACPQYHYVSL